jgi:hypothetical protein
MSNKNLRHTKIGHDALYISERIILDLYDDGHDIAQIMVKTGYSSAKVRNTISHFSGKPDHKFEQRIAEGSIALLAAVRATGGSYA